MSSSSAPQPSAPQPSVPRPCVPRPSAPPPSTPASRPAKDRVGLTIAALATVLGLWLGLVAPATSPVAPVVPAAPVAAVQGTTTPPAGAP